jgi:ribulose-5-phosphate 4-epimerase/fuculose-1-phosphate aldolase
MGEQHRYNIDVDSIIVTDLNGTPIEGDVNMITREGSTHFGVYNTFPQVGAVIDAHPRNILPFATAGIKIPCITDPMVHMFNNQEVEICEDADPATDALAKTVIYFMKRRESALNKFGSAVMIPKHGVLVAGRNLDYAYALLECLETAAFVYLKTLELKRLSGLF